MKALVTGGGGFLGGAIARLLLSRGWEVTVLARGSYPELEAGGARAVRGDICDPEAAARACDGADCVFHVAAKVGMWGPYREFHRVNVEGTDTVLKAARAAGVRKFVFTSTPSVVYPAGGGDVEGWTEKAPYPSSFDSHYARTKALAEILALASDSSSFSTVALRPHLVWGPGRDLLVSRIVAQGRAGRVRRIGEFNKLIDTTYIDDAAAAHLLAALKLAPGAPCAGKAYFISGGDPRPNWEIIGRILEAAGAPPPGGPLPYRAAKIAAAGLETAWKLLRLEGEPPLTKFVVQQLTTAHWFDISAARRDLGYSPAVTVEEGMSRLAAWFRKAQLT